MSSTFPERLNALFEEAREAGRAAGLAEAAQDFHGDQAAILASHLLADAAASVAGRMSAVNPGFAAVANKWANVMRDYTVLAKVTSVDPVLGTSGVPANSTVTALFEKNIDPATLTADTFTLAPASGGMRLGTTVTWDKPSKTARLVPTNPLSAGVTYKATVKASVTAAGGQPLGQDYEWTFTVAP